MNKPKPEFHLQRVGNDANGRQAQVFQIGKHRADLPLSRRGFLGTGISIGAALGLLGRCRAKADGEPASVVHAHENSVISLVVTPDGKLLISGDAFSLKIWSLPDGQLLQSLADPGPGGPSGRQVAVTPDSKLLMSSGYSDGTVKLWSLPDGQVLKTLMGHSSDVFSLAMTPDVINTLTPDTGGQGVGSLAITPHGDILATGDADATVRLWSLTQTGVVRASPGNNSLALSWEGRGTLEEADSVLGPWKPTENQNRTQTITTVGEKRFFRVKDEAPVPNGTLLKTLARHLREVRPLAVAPNGSLLLSGDGSGIIILWDLPAGQLRSFLFDPAVNCMSQKAVTYSMQDDNGQALTYTLPCDSAVPPNATCVCNCVQGSQGCGGGCTIIVCTCNPIFIPSDRAIKSNISDVDAHEILERLASLPIQSWNYNGEPSSTRHIGPMAQDFAAAFGMGGDARFINAVDAHGVTFAAIQALHELLKDKSEQLQSQRTLTTQLQQEFTALRQENAVLKARLETVELLARSLAGRSGSETISESEQPVNSPA